MMMELLDTPRSSNAALSFSGGHFEVDPGAAIEMADISMYRAPGCPAS
jgi:hypothetical protein